MARSLYLSLAEYHVKEATANMEGTRCINILITFTSLPARFSSFIVVQFIFFTNSFITLMLPMVIENKLKYLHLIMRKGSLLGQFRTCILKFILGREALGNKGDVTRDDSQRRFLAQHSVATLLRHCFE